MTVSDVALRVLAVIGIGAAVAAPVSVVQSAFGAPPYVAIPVLLAATLTCAWPIVKPFVDADYRFWKYALGMAASQIVMGIAMYLVD